MKHYVIVERMFKQITMKKILFVASSLKIGGIEKALVEQINSLSNHEDVTLFLFSKSGAYLKDVSNKVKVIGGNLVLRSIGLTNNESKRNLFTYLIRTFIAILVKLFDRERVFRIIFKLSQKHYKYDIAISYVHDQGPKSMYGGCNQYILSNVQSQYKYAWIHSDPAHAYIDKRIYTKMNGVVNVSMAMKEKFDKINIIPKSNSYCIYNRINVEDIIAKAKETSPYIIDKDSIIIVTVGRLEDLKGTKELLAIANNLNHNKVDFKWYFIGDGLLRNHCNEYIHKHNLNKKVILTGNLSNPYPYVLNADLFVSGSKTETFGLSIAESIILGTPVIAYRYDAIEEVIHKNSGIVCDTYDEIYENILSIIKDNNLLLRISCHSHYNYNSVNDKQIEALIQKY